MAFLLKEGERMEDRKKELVGNTAILIIGKVCTQFVNFFLLPLYTAILSPEEYGIVDLFNTYVTLLLPIVGLQFELALFRDLIDVRENNYKIKTLFSTSFFVCLISCVTYSLIYLVTQGFIRSEYKIFLLTHVIINVFSGLMMQFARGIGKNSIYALASFMSAAGTVVFNVVFVAVLKIGALGLFLGVVVGQGIAILYMILSLKIWRYIDLKCFDKAEVKNLSKYALPLIPANLSWWVIGASDRSIISYAIDVAANGIFSVASKFSTIVSAFFGIFNMAWTETVSLHIDDNDNTTFLSGLINELYNLFFSICIGIIALMPFIFPYFIDEKYSDAYPIIPILMVSVFAQIICGLFSVFFLAKKNTKESAKTAFYAAIINVVVDVCFIKSIGLYAAALSTFVAYFAMAIYRFFTIQKYAKIRIKISNLIYSIILTIFSCVAYYLDNILLRAIALVIVVFYAIIINRNTILGLLNAGKTFLLIKRR